MFIDKTEFYVKRCIYIYIYIYIYIWRERERETLLLYFTNFILFYFNLICSKDKCFTIW